MDGEAEGARDDGVVGVPRFVVSGEGGGGGKSVVDGALGVEAFLSAFERVEVGGGE